MSQCACVVMAGSLFESDDLKVWRAALSNYPRLLELKAAKRGKKSSKPDDLMQLDRWYFFLEIIGYSLNTHFHTLKIGIRIHYRRLFLKGKTHTSPTKSWVE